MRTASQSEELVVDGPAGPLEALYERPAEVGLLGAAVICHPHPLHGGTMQNKVAHTLARAFLGRRFAALRFNFRGVGNSGGIFDEGRGELEDALAALGWLENHHPAVPLWIAGFSFGAAIAVAAAAKREVAGLVSVAPAISRVGSHEGPQPACPWLVIQGDRDELVDVDETIAWINRLDSGPELQVFPETDHFFHGRLVPLREAVDAFIVRHTGAG
jgi:hypothetical protein